MSFNINQCPLCKVDLESTYHSNGILYKCNNVHYEHLNENRSHYTVWVNTDWEKYPYLFDTREVIAYPYLIITADDNPEYNCIFKLSKAGRRYIDKFPIFDITSETKMVKRIEKLLVFL